MLFYAITPVLEINVVLARTLVAGIIIATTDPIAQGVIVSIDVNVYFTGLLSSNNTDDEAEKHHGIKRGWAGMNRSVLCIQKNAVSRAPKVPDAGLWSRIPERAVHTGNCSTYLFLGGGASQVLIGLQRVRQDHNDNHLLPDPDPSSVARFSCISVLHCLRPPQAT